MLRSSIRFTFRTAAVALFTSSAALSAQLDDATASRFPAADPIEAGVSPEGLAALDDLVRQLVASDAIVGGELLVIKNGRTVLHSAHGMRDRESETPMGPGGVFCVRSMTKPLIGASIQMLVEDDVIELDDPVSKHLPLFDVDGKRGITVQQLLHHTGGMPMSQIMAADLTELRDIDYVAELGAKAELASEPGTEFRYSDQGTDTLTALIEAVSGMTAAAFVEKRILVPLGMTSSTCVMTEGHPLRERASSKYIGSAGAWTRFWSPEDPALFPFFLGSQGLYSSLEDYAKFLEMWMRKGRGPDGRILRIRSVRRTLERGTDSRVSPTGFPGLTANYGSLMTVWTAPGESEGDDREVVVFGHNGSDGTHGWAFPKQKAMVLYFTQSRGTASGLQVEEQLGSLLLGAPFDPMDAAPPIDDYVGYYRKDANDGYRAIVRDGDELVVDIVGKAVVPLRFAGGDRWKLSLDPSRVLEFYRDASGTVVGYHMDEHHELRFEPSEDLPSVDDVVAMVMQEHGAHRFPEVGTVHLQNRVKIEKLGLEGESESWIETPNRWRSIETMRGTSTHSAFDGSAVRMRTDDGAVEVLSDVLATSMRTETSFVRFGDWRTSFETIEVVQQLQDGDQHALLVRLGDASAPAATVFVNAKTGRVVRLDQVVQVPQLGRIGRSLRFDDFRDVDGMLLPHTTWVRLANSMIGTIEITTESVDVGVDVPDGLFTLED